MRKYKLITHHQHRALSKDTQLHFMIVKTNTFLKLNSCHVCSCPLFNNWDTIMVMRHVSLSMLAGLNISKDAKYFKQILIKYPSLCYS